MPRHGPTRIFLVRHAPVPRTALDRCYGQTDVPACPEQMAADAPRYAALAARLPRPARWLVTPLARTRQTAAAIFAAGYPAPAPAAELPAEPLLMEQHFGALHGLPHAEIPARLRAPPHPFWPVDAHERPEGGESVAEMMGRVARALEALAAAHAGRDVVVVSHGGPIRVAVGHALGLDPQRAMNFSVKNLSVTLIEHHRGGNGNGNGSGNGDGVWRVMAVNEVAA